VLAVDIDADCVRIANDNAAVNGVDHIVSGMLVDAKDEGGFVKQTCEQFEIIVSNIVASTIIDLSRAFAAVLAGNGRLIASGIIGERELEVRHAFEAVGLQIEDVRQMGEWRCIEARPTRVGAC